MVTDDQMSGCYDDDLVLDSFSLLYSCGSGSRGACHLHLRLARPPGAELEERVDGENGSRGKREESSSTDGGSETSLNSGYNSGDQEQSGEHAVVDKFH